MEHHAMHKSLALTRGLLAKQLKINPETLRYYEAEKLIKKPKRLANQYRAYDEEGIARIKFILAGKNLGFSLKEIKTLLNLSITDHSARDKARALALKKSDLISDKIQQLNHFKNLLDELIKLCDSDKTSAYCPILASMKENSSTDRV